MSALRSLSDAALEAAYVALACEPASRVDLARLSAVEAELARRGLA